MFRLHSGDENHAVSAGSFELSVLDAARKYSDFFALSATECSVSTLKTTMPSSLERLLEEVCLPDLPFAQYASDSEVPLKVPALLAQCPNPTFCCLVAAPLSLPGSS